MLPVSRHWLQRIRAHQEWGSLEALKRKERKCKHGRLPILGKTPAQGPNDAIVATRASCDDATRDAIKEHDLLELSGKLKKIAGKKGQITEKGQLSGRKK